MKNAFLNLTFKQAMKNHAKLPVIRHEAFTKGREALGLSAKALAAQACLSARQVEQLENGEQSSFYGSQVKITAAKKVAGILGIKDEEAFDYGEILKEQVAINNLKMPVEPKFKNKSAVAVKPIKTETVLQTLTQATGENKPNPQKRRVLWLSLIAAVVFSIINLRPLFFPEPVEEVLVASEEVLESTLPAAPLETAAATSTAPVEVSASTPVNSAPDLMPTCPAEDVAIASYKPEAPRKAADIVYVQVKARQVICVVDVTGKSQSKMVDPGVGGSFYGKPPFKLLTGGLNQVDVYFQGAKVRLTNPNTKTLILEPASVAAPTNQSDSEFR